MFPFLKFSFNNKRLLAVALLGFSSGLPLFLIGSTLQAWFTESHVSLTTIGLLSFVGIPYTLKFIWAPLLDYFSIPKLGLRRGWILCMQAGLVIVLCVLATMQPGVSAFSMFIVALVIAFLSASQDIAIDAYRTEILQPEERGLGSAYAIFTYRIAMLMAGGVALIVADYIGFSFTYYLMAMILLIIMIVTIQLPAVAEYPIATHHFLKTARAAFIDLWQRATIIAALLFLLFYKFGDALLGQLLTNFFLHGLGFSLTTIGFAYKVVGFTATVLGVLIGGIVLTRWQIYRALLVFGLLQAFSNFMFVVLAAVGKNLALMMLTVFIENGCSGLSTAALLAWMMSYCRHPFTASQFALLSAVASLGRVLLGPVAAFLVNHVGWEALFLWSFFLSFPGLIILYFIKNEAPLYATAMAD